MKNETFNEDMVTARNNRSEILHELKQMNKNFKNLNEIFRTLLMMIAFLTGVFIADIIWPLY